MLAVRRRVRELGGIARRPALITVTLLVAAAAVGLQLLAILEVAVGLVETVKRGLGSGLALLLGRFVFAEAIGGRAVVAVAVMSVGVALILL
jgi:multidrug transporter EmrE-like cation transporter